jgi:peptidoglycan-N-acetylglucosamine deacetylase
MRILVQAGGCAVLLLWATVAHAAVDLAVTVDDLPTHGPLPPHVSRFDVAAQMIDALRRHAVPGVYGFLNGGQLRDDPDLESIVDAWTRAGFRIANHTFSHTDLTRQGADEYIADIERNEAALARWAPAGSPRYFRYSYLHEGNTREKRDAVRRWLAARGYTVAQVTVYFEDWAWNDAYARCASRADASGIAEMKRLFMKSAMAQLAWSRELSTRVFKRQIKHILLLHIGAFDALMLDELLRAYRAAGVTLIGLDRAVRDPAYTIDPGLAFEEEKSFLRQVAEARRIPIPGGSSAPSEALARLCR